MQISSDCWITADGKTVLIERGKNHGDYFLPPGERPSKQYGLDLGYVRVSVLGEKNGSVLHFEIKNVNPQTSRLVVKAIENSNAEIISIVFHNPRYTLVSNLSPREAIEFLKRVANK